MKRLGMTVAIASACVIGATVWLYRVNLREVVGDSKATREHAISASPSAWPTAAPRTEIQRESEVSDGGDSAEVRKAIEAGNVPINFWGKIVDQDEAPLQGVRIGYAYSIYHGNDQGVPSIERETRKGETVSGGDGSFAITELSGHDLTIESLTKPGYLHRGRLQLAYDFGGNMPTKRFKPQRARPVRLAMIQVSATEPLLHVKGGLRVSGDGTIGRWSLWTGEPDNNGELAVSLKREPAIMARSGQLMEWSADLRVIGGEIVEAPWEEEVHRAPESGYSTTVPYPQGPQEEGAGCCSFYLRTSDGKYGRIQVELYPDDDGPTARCFITGDMNPRAGSRTLEPTAKE